MLLVLAALFLLAMPAQAGVSHDAGLRWSSRQSEHFRITYHEGLAEAAARVLRIAEAHYARLTVRYGWIPEGRIEILLSDEFDAANGAASGFPYNFMRLYLSPPDGVRGIEDHGGWLDILVEHELLHVIHLDKVAGAPRALRSVFGRNILLFPNALQPRWFMEGLAALEETHAERGVGRGQSSFFAMLMRMELQRGLLDVSEVNQTRAQWPAGATPYLYGVHFQTFLRERYGDARLRQLVESYSDNLVPFAINTNSRAVLGRDLHELWQEFQDWLRERYGEAGGGQGARRAGERLTRHGYFTGGVLADGRGGIFYLVDDGRDYPALWHRDARGRARRLTHFNATPRMDVDGQAGVLIAQPEVCNTARLYFDLYRVDPLSGAQQRLTRCARYRHAAWLPRGEGIIAVENRAGQSALHRLTADGERRAVLWSGDDGSVVAELDVAPHGRALVASVWRPRGGWNLERFDFASGRWQQLTRGAAIETQPRYTPDGRAVIYSADEGGTYDIYRLELASGRVQRLTRVGLGAFTPSLSADGRHLYYTGAHGEGFDIYQLSLDGAGVPVAPAPAAPSARPAPRPPAVALSAAEDYSPWASLRPRWWFPHIFVNDERAEYGVITSGWDLLQRHAFYADLAYDTRNAVWIGEFDYVYDRWWPVFKFSFDRSLELFRNNSGVLMGGRYDDEAQLEMVLPWLSFQDRLSLHLAALNVASRRAFVNPGFVSAPDFENNLAGLALVYRSTRRFPLSVSRTGQEILLVAEDYDAFGGSVATGQVYTLDWRGFVRLGGEHVLALRLVAGQGSDNPVPFQLGGVTDVRFVPPLLADTRVGTPFNRRNYALRGYDEGLPQLHGRRMRLASAEYRFPIARPERGWMAPPVGLLQIHARVFVESGAAWYNGSSPSRYYSSGGVEVIAETELFYNLPLVVSLGLASGFDDIGSDEVYLRLSTSF